MDMQHIIIDQFFPPLTLEHIISQGRVDRDLYFSREVYQVLNHSGYKDLGWLNSGVVPPKDIEFNTCYRNRSGSTVIEVNHEHKLYYSVDMGD
jgi:hypothetical protein